MTGRPGIVQFLDSNNHAQLNIKKLKPAWDWDVMDKNIIHPKQAFKRREFYNH